MRMSTTLVVLGFCLSLATAQSNAEERSPLSLPVVSEQSEATEAGIRPIDWRWRFRLETGPDRGQNIGTIFETRDRGTNPVICRAGFPQAAQARAPYDSRTLEFTCGFDHLPAARITRSNLGKPNAQSNRPEIRLLGRDLVDLSKSSVLRDAAWVPSPHLFPGAAFPIHWMQMVANKPLYFSSARNAIVYDGKPVLDFELSWRHSLYYGGRLFLAQYDVQERGEIVVCRWSPGDPLCVVEQRIPWPYQRDIYGLIGWKGSVFISASDGSDGEGAAVWKLAATRVERFFPSTVDGDMSRGEYYGMTILNETLVVGHYRTGRIVSIAHDGAPQSVLKEPPFPSAIRGGHLNDRPLSEAQTVLIYGGKLWLGTYPWGLLWSGSPDLKTWSYRRLFDAPPLDRGVGPFNSKMREFMNTADTRNNPKWKSDPSWLFASIWSQRVHNAAPWNHGVAFALTNMKGTLFDAERDTFASEAFYRSYGTIEHVRAPATVQHTMAWPASGAVEFTFSIVDGTMIIEENGVIVARRSIKGINFETDDLLVDRVGRGLYGQSEIRVIPLH